MKIAIFGAGYVGLVQGTVFAEIGHSVVCVDIDSEKIAALNRGVLPMYEPGLTEMVHQNMQANSLRFTCDAEQAVRGSQYIFLAVATPQAEDGSCDLTYVNAAVRSIVQYVNEDKVVVVKSTVTVGTTTEIAAYFAQELRRVGKRHRVDVVFNPEFLSQGRAVDCALQPERIVFGVSSARADEQMRKLYRYYENSTKIVTTNYETAELIKYAANAFLATKISYINLFANICNYYGASVCALSYAIGLDDRIGSKFLRAGVGYGGSCFPKDTEALVRIGDRAGVDMAMIEATIQINRRQAENAVGKIASRLKEVGGSTVALFGLSFKPDTDDLRDAPSIVLIKGLLARGYSVRAFDPVVKQIPELPATERLVYAEHELSCVDGADALVLVTEWRRFLHLDLEALGARMKSKVLIDLRNVYAADEILARGFRYYSVGNNLTIQSYMSPKSCVPEAADGACDDCAACQ